MPNLNRVMLMGNLTRDPELRYTPNNLAIVKLGLAINRRWRNQAGEQQEETTFVDCDGFGKTAEVINQYFKKGKPIFIEGRLKLDQWEDKEGGKRSKLNVVIENFQFVEARGDGGSGGGGNEDYGSRGGARQQSRGRSNPGAGQDAGPPAHTAIDEEDIPF